MKKILLNYLIFLPLLMECLFLNEQNRKKLISIKFKLILVLSFVSASLWAQPPHTFTADGSVVIPAGITTMDIQAWGAGGAGGGAGSSGLLNGRSGGGGGGGAYAHGLITVNPLSGVPLSVKVAGANAGTTATGTTGGSSTIQGFEGVILAVGGAGGTANTAGGAPAGGAGGLAAASIGSISTATGSTGGSGNTIVLGLTLTSGAGGTAGGTGGGAGGAALSTLLLGNGPGNSGSPPGGGGSGGLQTALNSPQLGGSGAHGQVIVTYTCPTYNITGISAANVCITSPTSLVTVTASAASLPVGIYNVTYSRGTPAATGLSATMTVSAAGTGNFTAVGLTTVGTSSITVTALTSGVCTSPISGIVANVTISPTTVAGSVSGGTAICNGAPSTLLSLAGNTGAVIRWESSVAPFSTWLPIVNTATTYTSGALTETTQFRAVVQSGACTALNSGLTTVTVNPLPQGSLSANGPFCATGAGQLTFTATSGVGPYTIVYNDGTANRTANNVTSGTAFATAVTPVLNTTTYTLVSVTDTNTTCVRSSGFTINSAAITVNPLPQGSLSANGPFCATGAGQLTFTASAGVGPYTIVYNDGTANRTANNVTSGTAFATAVTPVLNTTTYTLVSVTDTNTTCVRSSGFTINSAAITVNPLPQGSLSANGPFCATGAGQLTFTASAGVGPYTIVYNDGTANRTANNVVSGTAFATSVTPVLNTTTYTLVSITDANSCIRSSSFTGSSATITVNPLPQGSLSANGPFCATGAGQLTFTASAGVGPYTIVYNDGTANRTANNVTSGTAFATAVTPVLNTTTYTLVSVTDTNTTCVRSSGFTINSAAITVNPLPQGSLSANGPFCATGAGQLTFTASAGVGPFTIVYNDGTANRTANNVASGTAFATSVTPVLNTTTYTLVSVTDANSCIRSSSFTGSSATITVNPLPVPVFSAQPGATVCVDDNVTYTTLAGQTNYLWTVPGVAGIDYAIVSGGISTADNTVLLQWKTLGNKTVTVSYSSLGCAAVVNASNTTTVIKTEPGIVSGGTHVCSGNSSPLLILSGYNGTIVRWEYAESLPYVWQPISHTGITYQPGVLSTSTSYRAVIKNGTCAEDFSAETRIEIDLRPSVPVLGTPTQPTCINSTGSVVLSGLITGPNVILSQSGTSPQTYSNFGTSYTVTNLAPGTYYFTIQDGANCSSLSTIGVVITAPIINIWNGSVWSKGSAPINTDSVEFAGNYETTGSLSACSCIVHPGVNVTVKANHTLTIENSVDNNGGTFIFENNSSLLQINNSVNTGNIIYKRVTPPVRRYDFTYWSSPVTRTPAFTLHDLSPNTLIDKYERYDPLAGWIIINNGTAPMLAGVGYTVRAPQNYDINISAVYPASFEGVPNNGPYAISLGGAEKWSLLGNPYPSAIYADQFIVDNMANIYGTLYFWTHNSSPNSTTYAYTEEDYAIYNLSGSTVIGGMTGDGASTPGNNNPPLGYIAAGQSFFVKSKTGQNAVFTNSMRIAGNNTQFFKNTNTKIEKNRVWLNLTNTQGAFKQLLVGYIEGATDGWDTNYDGITADANKYLDFYSINGDLKLVIQGRALPFVDSDIVPLGYRSAIAGDFTISIDHADGNLSAQPIFLEDKKMGVMHDLRASNYTFTTAIGIFADRFVLRYKKTLGVEDFEKEEGNIIAFVKNKIIKITSYKEPISEVVIYDVSGKMLYDKKKIGDTELQIPNLQSGNQVLFVKVILENDHISTKKIVF